MSVLLLRDVEQILICHLRTCSFENVHEISHERDDLFVQCIFCYRWGKSVAKRRSSRIYFVFGYVVKI